MQGRKHVRSGGDAGNEWSGHRTKNKSSVDRLSASVAWLGNKNSCSWSSLLHALHFGPGKFRFYFELNAVEKKFVVTNVSSVYVYV